MISRRDKLLTQPWLDQKYESHKKKLQNAKSAVDVKTPPTYSHITRKLKKLQAENERIEKIKKENVRLLHRLGEIMTKKRLENFWHHSRPGFLNREKIHFNRPETCKARIEMKDEKASPPQELRIKLRGYSAGRCDTCSGRPVGRNQIFPEERIPWQPPKKSWNVKIYSKKFDRSHCCTHCQI